MDVKKKVFASWTGRRGRTPSSPAIPPPWTSTRSARRDLAARPGHRHALLQPRQRDAPAGDRARQGDLARRPSPPPWSWPDASEGGRAGRQLRRLRRQPHARPLSPRGGVPGRGRRARPQQVDKVHLRLRPAHGSVRDGRHGRARRGLAHPQGQGGHAQPAAALLPHRRPPLRAGALRPEDRRGLVPLREGQPRAAVPIPRSRRSSSKTSKEQGIERRPSPTRRSSSAASTPLINEGARILEEGIALRASTSTSSTSTATASRSIAAARCSTRTRWGWRAVYDDVCAFQKQHGELWQPAPLLERLAREGKRFRELLAVLPRGASWARPRAIIRGPWTRPSPASSSPISPRTSPGPSARRSWATWARRWSRSSAPAAATTRAPGRRPTGATESATFMSVNRNKRSLAVDLKSREGLAILERLVARADVFVQSLRAGAVEELGLGWEPARALNPRLVYCSVTAFGTEGPLRDRPGYDPLMQAMSRHHVHHRASRTSRPRACPSPSWTWARACGRPSPSSPRCASATAPGAACTSPPRSSRPRSPGRRSR